jgi:hypothetical protein
VYLQEAVGHFLAALQICSQSRKKKRDECPSVELLHGDIHTIDPMRLFDSAIAIFGVPMTEVYPSWVIRSVYENVKPAEAKTTFKSDLRRHDIVTYVVSA